MAIPKPAEELQIPIVNVSTNPSTAGSSVATAPTKKGDKLMKPTETLTAR
jgi:hypothetical protein